MAQKKSKKVKKAAKEKSKALLAVVEDVKPFDMSKLRNHDDVKVIKVLCPEWKKLGWGTIWVRSMTGRSRDAYEAAIYLAGVKAEKEGVGSNMDNVRANTAVATACKEDGTLLFKPSDAEWLGDMNSVALDRIMNAGNKLAGISEKDIEEMGKSLGIDLT